MSIVWRLRAFLRRKKFKRGNNEAVVKLQETSLRKRGSHDVHRLQNNSSGKRCFVSEAGRWEHHWSMVETDEKWVDDL